MCPSPQTAHHLRLVKTLAKMGFAKTFRFPIRLHLPLDHSY